METKRDDKKTWSDKPAKTLPARYYVDPVHFEHEVAEFFGKQWICAGRADQIPNAGDFFLRQIGKDSLIITRDKEGRVNALFNHCRHRGTQLCDEEKGNFKGRIQCPYHAWTYDLDGRLLGAPHMAETPGFKAADYPLHRAGCEVWDGHIFIHLGKNPPPLQDHLGELPARFAAWKMDDLRLGKRVVYPIAANWKLLIQNYSECLHCPVIHPALAKLSHYMSGDNEPRHPNYLGGRMSLNEGVKTMTMSGHTDRQTLPGLGEDGLRFVYYYWLSPNLLLSLHPDYVMTHTIWPKRADFSEVICEFHFHKDEVTKPGFSPEDAFEFWDLTNRQDWYVSELSQKGIASSAYEPGPYSLREGLLHDLDTIVTSKFPL